MTPTDKNTFLETAWNIGCQLMKSSIWYGDACTWQGYSMEPLNGTYQPVVKTFSADVYSGTSGIAQFLAALYSEKQDFLLLKTIEGCVAQMKATMNGTHNHGFYAGKPGIAATLIKLGKQFNRAEWIEDGARLLDSIPTDSLQTHEMDVISGAAGTIPVLIEASHTLSNAGLLHKAEELGHLLCNAATKANNVWSWATVPSRVNLTGYSHGSSGIAVALLQLYKETGVPIFLEGAGGGFNYERHSFDSAQQNWPDFRDGVSSPSTGNVCSLAWCHGAPGISLSRKKTKELAPEPFYDSEMNVALSTTATATYRALTDNLSNTNYSLCHGIAGNADILLESDKPDYHQLAEAVGSAGIYKYERNSIPWPTGVNTGHYTPGLMMGIAGTGYFYLRLFDREKHKTVLIPSLN